MAEQHGGLEQAAAGKSHGGLGGSYKVQGREGSQGWWAWGCSRASGSASLLGSPLQKGAAALPAIGGQEDTPLTMLVLNLLSSVSSSAEENWSRKCSLTQWGTEAQGSQETRC